MAPRGKKSVKPTVTPDSVHAGLPLHVTTINLGPWSPKSSVLPTRQLRGSRSGRCGEPPRFALAYLVLLRVEIARFTRTESARLCCSNPHLGALRPFGGEVLPPTLSCAVRTFLQCGLSARCLHNGLGSIAFATAFQLAPAAVWQASPVHYRRQSYPYGQNDRTSRSK